MRGFVRERELEARRGNLAGKQINVAARIEAWRRPVHPPLGFYVYLHRRQDDGQIFYVGKGVQWRAWDVENRSKQWKIENYWMGRTTEILMEGLTSNEALEVERLTIRLFLAGGHPLVNDHHN